MCYGTHFPIEIVGKQITTSAQLKERTGDREIDGEEGKTKRLIQNKQKCPLYLLLYARIFG